MNVPSTTRQRPSSGSSHSSGSGSADGDRNLVADGAPDNHSLETDLSTNADGNGSGNNTSDSQTNDAPLDAYRDARALIRLIQCQICSKPLQQPIALPCGQTLCKTCLPATFERENISYPNVPERLQGFVCPFRACERREHSVADCSVDVTLSRVLEGVATMMQSINTDDGSTELLLEELSPAGRDSLDGTQVHSHIFHGGRLASTYQMAYKGLLLHDSDVRYTLMSSEEPSRQKDDAQLLTQCLNLVRPEMECQVCYGLLLDPLTTSCGHTFCRGCLERVLDHSTLCPLCRRSLPPISNISFQPHNKAMANIINSLCPEAIHQRVVMEDILNESNGDPLIPIFVCALSFPTMPMFLHIFEPRYRLMIRRALESPSRSFGIVDYNRTGAPQGANGEFVAPFKQHGVLLHITGYQMLPDGRSLVETVGTTRFRVASYHEEDGYTVGKVDRIDDIPMADEEAMESMERLFHTFPEGSIPEWARLPTTELLQLGINFVSTMRRSSAGWFHDRVLRTYGMPPSDPATFPYWLATLLPVDDEEKYQLLLASSVRERLKIVVGWIKAMEQRNCDDVCPRHFASAHA